MPLFFFLAVGCGILVPRPGPGIEPVPPAVEVGSLNHWADREVPRCLFIHVVTNSPYAARFC